MHEVLSIPKDNSFVEHLVVSVFCRCKPLLESFGFDDVKVLSDSTILTGSS